METFDDENQRAGPIYRTDPTIGRFNPPRWGAWDNHYGMAPAGATKHSAV